MTISFDDFGLPEALTHTLKAMQFTTPTPIQAKAIPHALAGRDVLGSAQTGTGKTAAFGIPLVARLLSNPRGTALVMTPTRELANQVMEQLQAMLGKHSRIKTALLIGGEAMPKQLQQLRHQPRVLVGTPGRINDHLERGSLMMHDTSFLVLDETDRMLDLGFTVQIERILKFLPKTRQTMLFSATLPKNIVTIANTYLNNPVRVSVDSDSSPASNIKHDVVRVNDGEKHARLLQELDARSGSVILFMKTKYATEKMAAKLSQAGHSADAIHGDLRQNKRDKVIANFRNKKYRILVATDVAARGLDIPHIEHVINYDLPQSAEDYIHRIGRTARAGAEGSAVCLITPSDAGKWRAIHRLMAPEEAVKEMAHADNASAPSSRSKPRNKKWGNKPRRSESGESRGERKQSGERKQGERSRDDRGRDERNYGERKPSGERKQGERSRDDRGRDKRNYGERKPSGERKQGERKQGERSRDDRGRDERNYGERKPSGERKQGERSNSTRRFSSKPARPGFGSARRAA